jgi:radical SAM protein with 4Fe4S-binding SPASM domain
MKYSINDSIVLPTKYNTYCRDNWILLYDPVNVSWVRVNQDGIKLLELLKKEKTVTHVSHTLQKRAPEEPLENIMAVVSNYVDHLLAIGFLHIDKYRKRKFDFFCQDTPSDIYLMMTYNCNLKCKYCYNIEDRNRFNNEKSEGEESQLTFDEYKQLITDAYKIGVKRFILTGGEALLNPITIKLGKLILDKGMENELITNGLLVNESNAKEIAKSFKYITISLDSLNKESHEKMRGAYTFEKVLNCISLLKQHGALIRINSVITKTNVRDMKDTWKWVLEDLKCDTFTPSLFTPDSSDPEINVLFLPEMNELLTEQERIRNYFKDRPGIAVKRAKFRYSCGIANGEIGIASDGFVYPCHTLHKSELKCGNIRSIPLQKIIAESQLIKELREFNVNKISICRDCEFKYLCGGGCLALNYKVYGDFYTKNDFYCDYLKQEQIERMWTSTTNRQKNI